MTAAGGDHIQHMLLGRVLLQPLLHDIVLPQTPPELGLLLLLMVLYLTHAARIQSLRQRWPAGTHTYIIHKHMHTGRTHTPTDAAGRV